MRASCRLRQLRCWVVPCRDSSSSAGSVRRVPSLHSSVRLRLVYTRPLFLQALQASAFQNVKALLSSQAAQRHRHFLGSDSQSLPGVQEAAVPAAGADSVGIPLRYTRHRLRRSARISVVASCFYSTDSARSRGRSYPAPPLCRAHSFGPSRPRPGRPSVFPSMPVSSAPPSGRTASRRCIRSRARHPQRTRPPPQPRSTSFRALGQWETHCRPAQSHRTHPAVNETPSNQGLRTTHAPAISKPRPPSHARTTEKGY